MLVNIPPIRISKHPKGWVVEIQKKKWYGKTYWIHIISFSGLPSEPYYFSTYVSALDGATEYFRWDVIKNSYIKP